MLARETGQAGMNGVCVLATHPWVWVCVSCIQLGCDAGSPLRQDYSEEHILSWQVGPVRVIGCLFETQEAPVSALV